MFQHWTKLFPTKLLSHSHAMATSGRFLNISSALSSTANSEIVPMSNYVNRNPRNLERLAIAHKDLGFGHSSRNDGINEAVTKDYAKNYGCRNYYHRIHMQRGKSNVSIFLVHYSGQVVLQASTKEAQVRKELYAGADVSACENVARILAERMIRAGIQVVYWPETVCGQKKAPISEALTRARDAMMDVGISLEEPSKRHLVYKQRHWEETGPAPALLDGLHSPETPITYGYDPVKERHRL